MTMGYGNVGTRRQRISAAAKISFDSVVLSPPQNQPLLSFADENLRTNPTFVPVRAVPSKLPIMHFSFHFPNSFFQDLNSFP